MIWLTISNPFSKGRPCNRCIKRSIGHLCHDEPRESVTSFSSERNGTSGDVGATVIPDPNPTDVVTSHIDTLQKTNSPAQRTILEACSSSTVSTSQGDYPKLGSSTKGYGAESRLNVPFQNCKYQFCIPLRFSHI